MSIRDMGKILLLIGLVMALNGVSAMAANDVDSMMCDEGVVQMGDFFQTVQDKCGEPDKKEGRVWRYNFGPPQPVYVLMFDENGNLVRIVEDEAGN